MSEDVTLEDAVRVLNEKDHNSISAWEVETVFGEQIVRCENVYYTLTAFEAKAIAREYKRLDAPPAHGSIVEAMDELREAGGEAWGRVEDVDAELGRRPAVGPAMAAVAAKIREHYLKTVESERSLRIKSDGVLRIHLGRSLAEAFIRELEADR